ncbi:MAG: ABC transporter substrate-binding protein [Micromonosporaceae bacterium]|nr:ABC transporter substrate-binding protein [Micromonosporaceae bacterium]
MSHFDRREALKLLGALGGAGLTAACSAFTGGGDEPDRAPASSEPVRIGLLVPRSGSLKAVGDEMLNGFQLYLDLNGGQFGGHPVTLITEDEGASVDSGKAALDRLLKQDVLALTGVASSDVMLAVRDAVEQHQVPLVGSNASPKDLQGVIYIWRTSYVNDEPGLALGTYLARLVKGKIALIAPDNTVGKDVIDGFKFSFGREDPRISSGVIQTEDNPNPGNRFFAGALEQVRSIQPAAVFCTYAGAAAVQFVRQYRAAGLTAPIYAPGFLTEGSLPALGASARGIFTAMNYSPDLDNQANRQFTGAYRRAYGRVPTEYAMASYDAAAVLDKAVRLAGNTLTPQRINRMLGQVGQVDSPRGVWQFNTPRTPQQKWYLRQVRPDGPVLGNVTISDLATLG